MNLDYMNLWVKAAKERAKEVWASTKSYQESNDKVHVKLLQLSEEALCQGHSHPVASSA